MLIETSNAFSRELLHGIRDWMRANNAWTIHLTAQGRGDKPPAWLKGWRGDGIIARIETRAIARAVRACGVPVVNVSASGITTEFSTVISDSAAISRLAAQHLLERGFRRFACKGGDDELAAITRWLGGLARPTGIMTCYDIRGQQVLDACRKLGLRVPDEVAVIGQHNDELLCDLCQPPLSSVIPNAHLAGREAAALLEQLMHGRRIPPRIIRIAPVGVATRLSTDTVAVDDPRLAIAVSHIRDHACEPLQIDRVAAAAGLSRTALERLFRKHLGVSPYEQALRHRIARAELLLTTTSLSLAEIAEETGFSTAEHFANTFSRRTGTPPAARRRQHKALTRYEGQPAGSSLSRAAAPAVPGGLRDRVSGPS